MLIIINQFNPDTGRPSRNKELWTIKILLPNDTSKMNLVVRITDSKYPDIEESIVDYSNVAVLLSLLNKEMISKLSKQENAVNFLIKTVSTIQKFRLILRDISPLVSPGISDYSLRVAVWNLLMTDEGIAQFIQTKENFERLLSMKNDNLVYFSDTQAIKMAEFLAEHTDYIKDISDWHNLFSLLTHKSLLHSVDKDNNAIITHKIEVSYSAMTTCFNAIKTQLPTIINGSRENLIKMLLDVPFCLFAVVLKNNAALAVIKPNIMYFFAELFSHFDKQSKRKTDQNYRNQIALIAFELLSAEIEKNLSISSIVTNHDEIYGVDDMMIVINKFFNSSNIPAAGTKRKVNEFDSNDILFSELVVKMKASTSVKELKILIANAIISLFISTHLEEKNHASKRSAVRLLFSKPIDSTLSMERVNIDNPLSNKLFSMMKFVNQSDKQNQELTAVENTEDENTLRKLQTYL